MTAKKMKREDYKNVDYLKGVLEDSEEEEEEEDSDEELQIAFQKGLLSNTITREYIKQERLVINNVEGLREQLKRVSLNLPWIETLHLTCGPAPLAPEMALKMQMETNSTEINLKDDFSREMYFYRLAQSAVLEAVPRLHSLGMKTTRPVDYFAQMAKPDEHMQKVRKVLTKTKNQMELRDKSRKQRDLKKFGKRVQTEVLLQRQKEKKSMLDSVKKFRKGRTDNLDFLEEGYKAMDDGEDKPASKPKNLRKALDEARQKRRFKDKKFGFGGGKRHVKDVTAKDLDGPIHSKGRGQGKGFEVGKGKVFKKKFNMNKSAKNRRPGKEKRRQGKART